MLKKFIFYFIFSLLCTESILPSGETTVNSDNDITAINFIFKEAIRSGLTPSEALTSLSDYSEYKNGLVPLTVDKNNRQIIFISKLIINEKLKDTDLSFYSGPSLYPFDIYFNNNKITTIGEYKQYYNGYNYISKNIYLPEELINFNAGNYLVIFAFPYDETAELEFSIGPTKIVEGKIYFRNLFNVNLIQAICSMSFIFCLFFIFYFFSFSVADTKYLYFSLLCLSLGLSYMNIFYEHDANNELILEKLTRTALPFACYFLTAFIMKYTNTLNKLKYYIIIIIPTVIFGAWNLTMLHKSDVQKFFIHTSNFAITPQLILSITLLTLNTFKKKNKNALFLLIALLIVVATSLRDIYYVNNSITPYCWTVPYSFLLLCISILFILIMEQTATFNKAQVLAGEVFEKNSIQSSLIESITSLTRNINETGEIQNSAIAETIGILGKYENNNNTIINDIIKEIDELERSINSISDNIQKTGKKVVESINEQLEEVAQINESVNELNSHINMINENASETNENAKKLITYANSSKTIINSSINYIREIQDYTKFIENLLNSIEEITEKTGILSINASIEAANSGEKGKGFSVIAHEIRNLSVLTNKSLTSSLSHLKEMINVINMSKKQSEEVGNTLQNIIENLNMTASKLGSITQLIGEQMKQTAGIVEFTSKVQNASKNIHEFAINNNEENEKSLALLFRIENIFNDIKEKLSGQTNEVKVISGAIQKLEQSMQSNLKYIEELNSKIKK